MKHKFQGFKHPITTGYLYRSTTEINQDLIEAVRTSDEDQDSKTKIREARQVALRSLDGFSEQTISDIEASKNIENTLLDRVKNQSVDQIARRTRERVLSVLEGDTGVRPTSNPDYKKLITDLKKDSDQAEITVDSVQSAVETLRTLRDHYNAKYREFLSEQEANGSRYLLPWKRWSKERKTSDQKLYSVRAQSINDVFSNLDDQLQQRLSTSTEKLKHLTTSVAANFRDNYDIDQQKNIILFAQAELNGSNNAWSELSAELKALFFEAQDFNIRQELFRSLGWDTRSADEALKHTANQENQDLKNRIIKKREGLDRTLTAVNLGNLKSNLNIPDNEKPEFDDIAGLLDLLRPYIDQYGTHDRSQIFTNFSQLDSLNIYQEFAAYLAYLSQNESAEILKIMPKDLRAKILGCIIFIESKDSSDHHELVSDNFINFEKNTIQTRIDRTQQLFNQGLEGSNGLKEVKTVAHISNDTVFQAIEIYLSEVSSFEYEVENFISTASKAEASQLQEYRENLKKVENSLQDIKTEWQEALTEQKQKQDDFKRSLKQAETRYPIGSGDGQTVNINGTTLECPASPSTENTDKSKGEAILIRANQDRIDAFKKVTGELIKNKPAANQKVPIKQIEMTLLGQVEVMQKKIERQVTERNIDPNEFLQAKFNRSLVDRSAELDNKMAVEDLDSNQQKQLEFLKKKPRGSSIELTYKSYQHGNPPSSNEMIDGTRAEGPINLIIMESGTSGVVCLNQDTKQLVFIQYSDQNKRVEAIALSGEIYANGVPENFSPDSNYEYIASPVSMLPA